MDDYDLFEDVIAKIRFEKLTRAEQHAQLRRVANRPADRVIVHDSAACSLANGRGPKCTCDAYDPPQQAPAGAWRVVAPDGSTFFGETPLKASVLASRYHRATDPEAAKRFAEVIEQFAAEGAAEREQMLSQFGTLDCPACGGSGHIGDLVATAPTAWRDVMAERRRQVAVEGYTAEHDNQLLSDELATAGACYALSSDPKMCPVEWPWSADAWKPRNYRSNLVRGTALMLAAIERLDRGDAAINEAAP